MELAWNRWYSTPQGPQADDARPRRKPGELADDLHLVYAETRRDRLDWLKPLPSIDPMRDVLGIDDILRAQGYRRTSDGNQDGFWQADADSRASLTRKMGDEAERYDKFFGTLNRLSPTSL